jgi:hypothetical protein
VKEAAVDPFLKLAYEEGQRLAEAELAQKLKDAVKKRQALVGWKEKDLSPQRLSQTSK